MERKLYFYTDQMTVGYGGRPLIKNIRMEVEKGEILTLIGPNGAGKLVSALLQFFFQIHASDPDLQNAFFRTKQFHIRLHPDNGQMLLY